MKNILNLKTDLLKVSFSLLIIACCTSVYAQQIGGFPVWPFATSQGTRFIDMNNGGILSPVHSNSQSETAAIPAFACGELKFYCKHTGALTTNQLEIFSANGTKLLGSGVPFPSNIGLNASADDPEIQVVPVPTKQNEWYIIYNETPATYSPSPFSYQPTKILYSRVQFDCCDNKLTVITTDTLKQKERARTYRTGKAVSRLIGNKHYLYLFQRDNYFTSNSDNQYNRSGSFTIDRFEITSQGIGNCQLSATVQDTVWFQETVVIELKPNDETQIAVLKRNQGLEGSEKENGCEKINVDSLSYKPLLYLYNTNQQNTQLAPTLITQTPIDFTTLKITGLTLGNSDDLSIREYCTHELKPNDNRQYLQNFWRKIYGIEYSPNGQYIYLTAGGFVKGGYTNLTYLGQIKVNNEGNNLEIGNWIRLQCQTVNNANDNTGVGNPTSGNNSDRMIQNIESATNGRLYFVKSNSDTLYTISNPNGLLPVDLSRHHVNINPSDNIVLGSQYRPTGLGCYFLPDQIDQYLNYLPNGQNPTINGIPTNPITAGTPINLSTSSTIPVTWSVSPAASLTPITGTSTTFIANEPGEYVICADNSACCISDTINVLPGNPPSPCCDLRQLEVQLPDNSAVTDHGSFYGLNTNLNINSGIELIEELRISIISFELAYSEPECTKCYNHYSYMGTFLLQSSPASLGSLSQQSLPHYNTSTIPGTSPTLNGVREIIWKGIPAQLGVISPNIEILFPKPILPNCCNVKVKTCIKLVFKNADCDICEKYICLEFDKNGMLSKASRTSVKTLTPNNYGINDEGIKRTPSFTSVNNYGINDDGIKKTIDTGDRVPGALITAEVWNEVKKVYEEVVSGKTDHIGTYHFKNLKSGKYKLFCKLPKETDSFVKKAELTKAQKLHINFILEGIQKSPVTFGSKTASRPLVFESPEFILREELNSFKVAVVISANNYGINDDGIKLTGEPVPGAEVYIETEESWEESGDSRWHI